MEKKESMLVHVSSGRSGGLADLSVVPDSEVPEKAVRRRFTAEYKRRILREAEACKEQGRLGALLRREGLYSSNLITPGGDKRSWEN